MAKKEKSETRKEDLRVQRTKKSLNDSFFKMLSEMTFEEISINDLCEAAGVRRATFYKHYRDKYDFLTKLIGSIRDEFEAKEWRADRPMNTKDYYVSYVSSLIHYLNEHYLAAEKIMQSGIREMLVGIIAKHNYQETKSRLEKSVSEGMTLPASIDTIAFMLVGGVTQILMSWVADGRSKSPELLCSELGSIISKILES